LSPQQRAAPATVTPQNEARNKQLKPQQDILDEKYKNDPERLAEEGDKLDAAHPLPPLPISKLIDHIDHIVKVAGIDHVGIGADFDGAVDMPEGAQDVSMLPNITYELLKRGYSEKDIRKILGENFLRVFAEVERVSRSMSRSISGEGSTKRISANQTSQPLRADYRIKSKDLIEFDLVGVTRNCCLEVDDRGLVQIPYVESEIHATGKTADELTAELIAYFKRHLRHPQVQIRVHESGAK